MCWAARCGRERHCLTREVGNGYKRLQNRADSWALLVGLCMCIYGVSGANAKMTRFEIEAKIKLDKLQGILEGREDERALREFLDFVQQGEVRLVVPPSLDSPDKQVLALLHLGAVTAVTDLISTVADTRMVAWASQSIAVLCRASKLCREEARKAGTMTTMLRAVKKGSGLDEDPLVTSAVAEAICSLVFASKENHQEAVRRGAVASMMGMATKAESPVTVMWALAALHFLAEDYCASSTGRCPWVVVAYQARGVAPDRRGHSDLNARLLVDSSDVRLTMNTLGLIAAVVEFVKPSSRCPANITQQEAARLPSSHSLSGWAAAAVVKSLALTPALQPLIVAAGGMPALGKTRRGGCVLEEEEAEGALERIMSVASTREVFAAEDWEAVWDSSGSNAIGGSRWRDQIIKEEL